MSERQKGRLPFTWIDGRRSAEMDPTGDSFGGQASPAFSLFETLLVRPGRGDTLFVPEQHIDRLLRSAARLGRSGMPPAETVSDWVFHAARTFAAACADEAGRRIFGRLRITAVWSGDRSAASPRVVVTVMPYDRPLEPARVVQTPFHLPPSGSGGSHKTGDRTVYDRAQRWADEQRADEGLLLGARTTSGAMTPAEGARSNVFVWDGTAVLSPPLTVGVLPGITRGIVLRLARDVPVPVREATVDTETLMASARQGGVFLTNALWGVRPVSAVDGHAAGSVHELVIALRKAYEDAADGDRQRLATADTN